MSAVPSEEQARASLSENSLLYTGRYLDGGVVPIKIGSPHTLLLAALQYIDDIFCIPSQPLFLLITST